LGYREAEAAVEAGEMTEKYLAMRLPTDTEHEEKRQG
jgi:hypothetical protein